MYYNFKTKKEISAVVPLYDYHIKLHVCSHDDLPDNDRIDSDAFGGFNEASWRIWINSAHVANDVMFLQTLMHECVHAAYAIVRAVSCDTMPTDLIGEESICYISDSLFGSYLRGLK